ncbi:NUDIX domain-containing protein [Bradyrhizobium sp. CIR3A]|uniref:NUDIX domain-containing protein n=1 Tax=Bradyrhizobium sp. CIR3A TaxID=2663838 RepID=UPI0016059CE3|nr:NUDIX domain-containing protein [Bradyrhizobium sp. CIR3A]MBB4258765.1 protein-tyrosine-phosphatase/8-oxo-dGTP pyrophosphatase MutT (NUDIX family) [Bradyrhizobium sp. CIR3A]
MTSPHLRDFSSAILIDDTGRLLLQLRDDKPSIAQPGKVSFFGGRREEGETPRECIVREVTEEIGVALSLENFQHLVTLDIPDPENVGGHVKGVYFIARGINASSLNVTEGKLVIVEAEKVSGIRDKLTPLTAIVLHTYLASRMTDGCKRILFLCTGNYYRSRFAEELFNHLSEQENLRWRAFSRGAAESGSPDNIGTISRYVIQALQGLGISARGAHELPRPCSLTDFSQADIVIGLKEAEHRSMIERRFPALAGRVLYWQVDDIDGADPSDVLPHLAQMVENLIAILRIDDLLS